MRNGFLALLIIAGMFALLHRASPPTEATPIGAPVLKWQYGGCSAQSCETGWYASPAVADIDGDSQPEVMWGAYDLVALNGGDGSVQWRADNNNRIWPAIAVADLTNNGSLEIIVGRNNNQLTVYNNNGSVLWTRSPFANGEVRTLAVADLEADGSREIIVGRASGGATLQLNVYQANGTVRPGWPARHNGEPGYGWGMYNENVTVADYNNDGFKEIIGPTDTHYITALDRNGNQLLANPIYNDDGVTKVWSQAGVHVDHAADLRGYANCGTEHRPNFANAAPASADVDGNGTMEIIVAGDVYNCAIGDPDGDMYYLPWIFNLDRTRWSNNSFNWTVLPKPSANSGPKIQGEYSVIEDAVTNVVVADLDTDGLKEILYPSYDGKIHAFWLDKTQHGNWPFTVPGSGIRFAGEPAVVDINNDGKAEVIFTSWPEKHDRLVGQLHILDYNGNQLHAINLPAPAGTKVWNGGLAAPTVANIDGDADLEIVVGTSGSGVVAYDLPNSAGARPLWATGRGSNLRTGVAQPNHFIVLTTPRATQNIGYGETTSFVVRLAGTIPNNVALSATVPAGLEWSLTPNTLVAPDEAILTITDTHTVSQEPGTLYNLSVTAASPPYTSTIDLNLFVDATKSFIPVLRR